MLEHNKNYRKISKAVGLAAWTYRMFEANERISVGLSGGKDSLTLLKVLRERQKISAVPYSLHPIYVDPGFEPGFSLELSLWCKKLGLDLLVERTKHGLLAHSPENRKKSPCFFCALQRRKSLFRLSEELGCKTLALGHTKDDMIETLFLNMCYAGKIGTMMPRQEFFKGKFHIIRPLTLVEEPFIRKLVRDFPEDFPVFENACPSAGKTKRKDIKDFLQTLYSKDKKIKNNLFRSMENIAMDYMPQPRREEREGEFP
ncbi:tRNA 2-thiocytidine(32) synthetase TtcA [Desulfococcaceae bacterium OttesenSCG-928-F15]|nr:tRNA 2-thiocytidine(32) synthetase TtcA [Desulfococcaceae bacterium OttesenSCG-928-F15]